MRRCRSRCCRSKHLIVTKSKLILLYGAFAIFAIAANLGVQRCILYVSKGVEGYIAAVICGTGVGLWLKYLLDRRWIFRVPASGVAQHRRDFTLYTAMGIITTLIFWTSETVFWIVWKTDLMRELGAILGLIVGYTVKYNLDKRFVFQTIRTTG